MNIRLYTIPNCPQCALIKQKLDAMKADYEVVCDPEAIASLGYQTAPILSIDDHTYNFAESIKMLNQPDAIGKADKQEDERPIDIEPSRADKYEPWRKDLDFMHAYAEAQNAASGSQVDANANVSNKNIATMAPEIHKKDNIYANRLLMYDTITELFGTELAEEYLRQLEQHEIYRHDESGMPVGTPYCASITLYPFLFDGMTKLGGTTGAPHHLRSFCGGFINLVFAVSAQLCGAVATPEFLAYMDYFIRKEYGDHYYEHPQQIVDLSNEHRTIDDVIVDSFAQVVYSLNQPAAARGSQSVFWNIAYFDKYYFDQLFDGFVFPDGTSMQWESVSWLQKRFMNWFNAERLKNVLTFPVESLSLLNDGEDFLDQDWANFAAEMYANGHSFFTYTSDSVDSLASCCRLRNGIQDNHFSYTLGAGGVATGSKCVMTINLNRLIQDGARANHDADWHTWLSPLVDKQVRKVHKYLLAFDHIVHDMNDKHMLPIYEAGFIAPEKQYLTVGINGLTEAAEFLKIPIKDCAEYREFVDSVMLPIFNANKEAKTDKVMFNTEMVPAENLGVKHAKWDKRDGYFVPRDCYNSYFYLVEDETTNPIDKFRLHGRAYTGHLDGGSALHCNLDEHLSKAQYMHLLHYAIKTGCNYFTFNIPNTICNDCGHISKHRLQRCPKCGSENLDYATRVIGYLTRISKWSAERKKEAARRYYAGADTV